MAVGSDRADPTPPAPDAGRTSPRRSPPRTPRETASRNRSGSPVRSPVDFDRARGQIDLADHFRPRREEALSAFVLDAHHIVSAGSDESRHAAQTLALLVHYLQADQIDLVELVLCRLRQILAPQGHLGSAVRAGLLRTVASFEARHQVGAVRAALRHRDLVDLPRPADPPRGILAEVAASGAEGLDLQSALHAPGRHHAPHHHPPGWRRQPAPQDRATWPRRQPAPCSPLGGAPPSGSTARPCPASTSTGRSRTAATRGPRAPSDRRTRRAR